MYIYYVPTENGPEVEAAAWNLKNVTTSLMTLYNDIHREMANILAILFHP